MERQIGELSIGGRSLDAGCNFSGGAAWCGGDRRLGLGGGALIQSFSLLVRIERTVRACTPPSPPERPVNFIKL